MRRTNFDDKIFEQLITGNDKIVFNMLNNRKINEKAFVYTDDEAIIICKFDDLSPVWVWSDDNIEDSSILKILDMQKELIAADQSARFVFKKRIADRILRLTKESLASYALLYSQISVYDCKIPIKPVTMSGFVRKAGLSDLNLISEYRAADIRETEDMETAAKEQMPSVKASIESGNMYMWLDRNQKATTIAYIADRSNQQARINSVYTAPIYRNKGYAAMLMYELSSMLQREGRIGVVYVKSDNLAARSAYQKSGYKECGVLSGIIFKNNFV